VTGASLTRLTETDLADVARLWCQAPASAGRLGDSFPLSERALRHWWASSDTDPALCFALRDGDRLLGAALARAPERSWSAPELGHLSLLVVDANARGHGYGRALIEAALAALRERGRRRVVLGTEPDHLLPGVPIGVDDASWRCLLRAGVRPGSMEHDVRVDLNVFEAGRFAALATANSTGGDGAVELVDDDPDAAIAFTERVFPGRWADEVRSYADAGVTLLTLRERGATLAFAAAFRLSDALLGPSLTWHSALPGPAAGLGPLGVDPDVRGRGLGRAIVAAGLHWHAERGARDVILNWTSLTSFYGQLGARVWRSYQRAEFEPTTVRS